MMPLALVPTLDESDKLLVEALAGRAASATLLYGTSALASLLAAAGPLELRTTSATDQGRAQQLAGVTVRDTVMLDQAQYGQFDCAIIAAPQSRVLARRWLCEAQVALKPGGVLYLGGANDFGIRSLIDDATALFGHSHTLLTKRHARVARAVRPALLPTPQWAALAGIAPGTWYEFAQVTPHGVQTWSSLPGIFSYDQIDSATQLLLDQIGDLSGQRVLDIGCGYGIIGIAAAQRGAAAADMIDEDLYAVAATRRNIAAFGLSNARVVAAEATYAPFNGPYDLVVTNPPFHRGKAVDYAIAHGFIGYARRVLGPRGRLLLVANSFIRYDTVLAKQFAHVEQLTHTPSFTLWLALVG